MWPRGRQAVPTVMRVGRGSPNGRADLRDFNLTPQVAQKHDQATRLGGGARLTDRSRAKQAMPGQRRFPAKAE
jgi:hypothetical protein